MKKQSKINTLYLPIYAMELSKIYFKNGSSIRILDYIKKTSMPMDLQKAILKQSYSEVLKLIRKYTKNDGFKKSVSIKYTCACWSTISNTWHFIENDLAAGLYNNFKQIKEVIENKRIKNNNENIEDLKFQLKFYFN
jgi:hypothetical protein